MARISSLRISSSALLLQKGCWQPRIFTESDPGYCDGVSEHFSTEDLNRDLEFRHDLLDNIHVQTPLLFVSHEARSISLIWARSHGIEICGDPLFPRLSLPFNPVRDILYLPATEGYNFFMEPHNRSSEEDIINLTPGIFNEVKRLAVTKSGLEAYSVMATSNGFSDHYRIEALYIIIKKPRSLLPVDDDLHVQSRWECASLTSRAFILDSNRSVFELKGNGDNKDEQRHLLTQEISRHLTPEFITNSPSIREIRPVSAVKG